MSKYLNESCFVLFSHLMILKTAVPAQPYSAGHIKKKRHAYSPQQVVVDGFDPHAVCVSDQWTHVVKEQLHSGHPCPHAPERKHHDMSVKAA